MNINFIKLNRFNYQMLLIFSSYITFQKVLHTQIKIIEREDITKTSFLRTYYIAYFLLCKTHQIQKIRKLIVSILLDTATMGELFRSVAIAKHLQTSHANLLNIVKLYGQFYIIVKL